MYPNAYYNYRKHRKADYYAHKSEVLEQIEEIYHEHNGVDGYRSMTVYLGRKTYSYSPTTIHKYMSTELGLPSIVRPKKPDYEHGKPHKECKSTFGICGSVGRDSVRCGGGLLSAGKTEA